MNKLLLSSLFLIFSFSSIYAQLGGNQDCVTKKKICGTTTLNDNNNGSGTVIDLNASNTGCLDGDAPDELNSSWYSFKIETSGTLIFSMSPVNGTDDYDFAVWGPNPNCPPTSLPLRCSARCFGNIAWCGPGGSCASGVTGLSMAATDVSETPGAGDGMVKYLNVTAGQTYIFMVNNATPVINDGFTFNFGGTAVIEECAAVYVQLISFVAQPKDDKVSLVWKTATEMNSDYFFIEKSYDGKDFFNLSGKIKSAGNSKLIKEYTFLDNNPGNKPYYRLKEVDINGKINTHQIISLLSNGKGDFEVSGYKANLGNNEFIIKYHSDKSVLATVQICDILGNVVLKSQQVFNEEKNELSFELKKPLSTNIYFLQINSETISYSKKLIIE